MFNQPAPSLGNQYTDDRVLRSYLAQALPKEVFDDIQPQLMELGELSGGKLYQYQLADRKNEPNLTQWDAWGNRVDHVELSPLWREAEQLAATHGLIATAYEQKHERYSRIHQFVLAYLLGASTDVYNCPLAMTDGAARALIQSQNQELIERALPHLTSRNPKTFWTSGQWMTESIGGSDVSLSETVARFDKNKNLWHLYGKKWFTSAATSQIALTLARPEGNPQNSRGLALFYVETLNGGGKLQDIVIHRLKDKMGTRKVATAELTLDATPAKLVAGTTDGVRHIAPMLNITRIWNAVSALANMRRGIALARDYAKKRYIFGSLLSEKALHLDTLAELQAEFEAAFHLTFYVVEWIGKSETSQLSNDELSYLRLLTTIAKLVTGKQAVVVVSEAIEAFGGAGYVEDTGLPTLLRDSHVFPIWEGTTNVLSLEVLRAMQSPATVTLFLEEFSKLIETISDLRLLKAVEIAQKAISHAEDWFLHTQEDRLEAGARRCAMMLGRGLALVLLARHAQWSLLYENDTRSLMAAEKFAQSGIDLIIGENLMANRALALDEPPLERRHR